MRILVFCPGFSENRISLQPWKYFYSIAGELVKMGHEVFIASDEKTAEETSMKHRPDAVLVSLGPVSRFHMGLIARLKAVRIGVITFPIYTLGEILHVGPRNLIADFRHTVQHIFAALVGTFTTSVRWNTLDLVVTETNENLRRLLRQGVPERAVTCIMPGLDEAFCRVTEATVRTDSEEVLKVVYLGSALPVRGASDLVDAVKSLDDIHDKIHLDMWMRLDPGTAEHLTRLRTAVDGMSNTCLYEKSLTAEEVAKIMKDASAVVFPFRLIPSESPLGPLEALAVGSLVVVPRIAALADLETSGAVCYSCCSRTALANELRRLATSGHHASFKAVPNRTRNWQAAALELESKLNELLAEK